MEEAWMRRPPMGLLTSRKNLIAARDTRVAPKKLVYIATRALLSEKTRSSTSSMPTHLKHRLAIRHRHSFHLPNSRIASVIMYDIDSSKSSLGLLEGSIDIFLIFDVDFDDEEFIRTILRLVLLHGFWLTDGSDNDMAIGKEVFSHGEAHAIASASDCSFKYIIRMPSPLHGRETGDTHQTKSEGAWCMREMNLIPGAMIRTLIYDYIYVCVHATWSSRDRMELMLNTYATGAEVK